MLSGSDIDTCAYQPARISSSAPLDAGGPGNWTGPGSRRGANHLPGVGFLGLHTMSASSSSSGASAAMRTPPPNPSSEITTVMPMEL